MEEKVTVFFDDFGQPSHIWLPAGEGGRSYPEFACGEVVADWFVPRDRHQCDPEGVVRTIVCDDCRRYVREELKKSKGSDKKKK